MPSSICGRDSIWPAPASSQYAGLPVIAPDAAIFREVLGESGIHVDTADPAAAAMQIAAALSNADWRARHVTLAARNLARWNDLARGDRENVISLIARLAHLRVNARPEYRRVA